MFNLYVAEKQKKQKEEKLKEEMLETRIKINRKSKYNKIKIYVKK
jgi:hypothetical protein